MRACRRASLLNMIEFQQIIELIILMPIQYHRHIGDEAVRETVMASSTRFASHSNADSSMSMYFSNAAIVHAEHVSCYS